jgi:multiple sugar transport system permease protein
MFSSAFKNMSEVFKFPPTLIPTTLNLQNFTAVWQYVPFGINYLNSLYIAVLVTLGTLFISSLAGYAFARIPFKFSALIFMVLLTAMMMPDEVTIVPNFLFMSALHFLDSHIPLIIIPILGSSGVLATFIMRQTYLNLPKEIEDAAMLDGLGRFGIYWRIAIPMATPALAAVAILTFLTSWNLYLQPLIYLTKRNLWTLPLALTGITDEYGNPIWNVQFAATTMAVLPILILYFAAQRKVVESFSLSGTKG